MLKADIYDVLTFQSTPSYEGERSTYLEIESGQNHFNPLPHTRENVITIFTSYDLHNFNPLPHTRENIIVPKSALEIVYISIHSLIRGRTSAALALHQQIITFQSTPSYEGEP